MWYISCRRSLTINWFGTVCPTIATPLIFVTTSHLRRSARGNQTTVGANMALSTPNILSTAMIVANAQNNCYIGALAMLHVKFFRSPPPPRERCCHQSRSCNCNRTSSVYWSSSWFIDISTSHPTMSHLLWWNNNGNDRATSTEEEAMSHEKRALLEWRWSEWACRKARRTRIRYSLLPPFPKFCFLTTPPLRWGRAIIRLLDLHVEVLWRGKNRRWSRCQLQNVIERWMYIRDLRL